jgi:hypothetical protein
MNKFNESLVLSDLDKHASEFNFPMLDNAYVAFAAGRLSVFVNEDHWALAFEVLGYSINRAAFVDDLYAFGDCLPREGVLTSFSVLTEASQAPLIDPATEAWIADWSDWSISSSSDTFRFRPSRSEYSSAGIHLEGESGPGSLPQKDVLRFFIAEKMTPSLFLSESELIGELNGCPPMRLLLQTESWQHPDVANGEMPSESGSFQSLMKVIAEKSASLFVPGNVNTSWPVWDHDAEE